jgi:proprotein convertase subtilisin/kexin type 5
MDASGKCIENCPSGYTYNSKACELISSANKCSTGTTQIGNSCFPNCQPGFFMDASGNCIENCPSGYTYNSKACELISSANKCSTGTTQIGSNCFPNCQPGFFMDASGKCIENCPSGYTYNSNSKVCELISSANKCSTGTTQIGSNCFPNCQPGFFMDASGNCIQNCPPGYTYNSKVCELISSANKCSTGTTQIGSNCFPNCQTGFFMDASGKCIENCPTGYTYNSKACELVSSANKCSTGTTQIGNSCFSNCQTGFFMDASGKCIENCPTGYTYNSKACELVSSANKCSPGTTQIGSNCFPNCQTGFFMDASGNCIENCSTGYTYNSKACELISSANKCSTGTTQIGNSCFPNCQPGFFMDVSGNCIENCPAGYTYNSNNQTCELVSSANKCSLGKTQLGSKCFTNCPSGYIMDGSGNCIENCPSNYTYNSSTQVCELISSPNKCSPGTTQLGSNCFRNCPSGYFMDISGNCIQNCKSNYTFNQTLNLCVFNKLN